MPKTDQIADLPRAYSNAVYARDPARLAALYDADVLVFDTWAPHPFRGLAAWCANLDGWLNTLSDQESVQVSFDDVQISGGADMGCLQARVTYAALNGAGEILRAMQNRLSWVAVRKADGWAIIHEHTSVAIGPDLKGILQPD